jgi:hypothetical protein
MKLKFKLIPVLLVGIALTYTACKKSASSQSLDAKTVSSQVALNLSQTLYNGFGGFNLSGGVNSPSGLGVDRNTIRLNLSKSRLHINDDGSDITCGLKIDTTLNDSITVNGTQATVAGSISFGFLCSNGTPSGFSVGDDLTVTESSSQVSGTTKLLEDLTLLLSNPQDANSTVSLNGTVSFNDNLKISGKTTTESYNYTFTSIVVDSSGIIANGSATFATKGNNSSASWDYSGTVVFLGNQKIKITINGTAYNVDLQTGVVS